MEACRGLRGPPQLLPTASALAASDQQADPLESLDATVAALTERIPPAVQLLPTEADLVIAAELPPAPAVSPVQPELNVLQACCLPPPPPAPGARWLRYLSPPLPAYCSVTRSPT